MISVIIPTYKNKEMLLGNLKNNLKFLKGYEVIIINDYPEESLKDFLQEIKEIKLIENEKNLGFGETVNIGVKKAKNKYIMLLNSDVILNSSLFQTALEHFQKDENLFAVSFAQTDKSARVGKNLIYWKNGLFHHKKAADFKFGINAWAEGGACIIDRQKYIRLGGFDKLYAPFYWEDIDLSYRAWKQGYKVMFEPKILVVHRHESTIGKYFKSDFVQTIAFRNQLIFVWKNITDRNLLFNHLLYLPRFFFSLSFWGAIIHLPTILKARKNQKKLFTISDNEILKKFID